MHVRVHACVGILGGEEARGDEVDARRVPHVRRLAVLQPDVAARLQLHLHTHAHTRTHTRTHIRTQAQTQTQSQ